MTDAEGLTTTYTYDALGRTICETRPGFRGALLITSNEGEFIEIPTRGLVSRRIFCYHMRQQVYKHSRS